MNALIQRQEPAPIAGEFTSKPHTGGRGIWFITPGGAQGRYVGTTFAGTEWVWYEDADYTFEEMCGIFDSMNGI